MAVELDSAFIQAVEHRPKPRSVEALNIPLNDLSPLNSAADSASVLALAAEIGGACRDWGFFQVINHGVPPECGKRVESAARKFFALPESEKMKVSKDAANPFGYYDGEHTKNVRDWKEVFDFAVENPIVFPVLNDQGDLELRKLFNKWPENFPELRFVFPSLYSFFRISARL